MVMMGASIGRLTSRRYIAVDRADRLRDHPYLCTERPGIGDAPRAGRAANGQHASVIDEPSSRSSGPSASESMPEGDLNPHGAKPRQILSIRSLLITVFISITCKRQYEIVYVFRENLANSLNVSVSNLLKIGYRPISGLSVKVRTISLGPITRN